MRKLLIGGVIVLLAIFTTGLATATPPTPSCTSSAPCTGTLWFADNTGTITTGTPPTGVWTVTNTTTAPVTIYVSQYGTIAGEPSSIANDLFSGQLQYTDPANGLTTVKFSAIKGWDGVFSFNGASTWTAGGSADVRGTFEFKFVKSQGQDSHGRGGHGGNWQLSLVIRGAILADTAGVSNAESFEGVFTAPSN